MGQILSTQCFRNVFQRLRYFFQRRDSFPLLMKLPGVALQIVFRLVDPIVVIKLTMLCRPVQTADFKLQAKMLSWDYANFKIDLTLLDHSTLTLKYGKVRKNKSKSVQIDGLIMKLQVLRHDNQHTSWLIEPKGIISKYSFMTKLTAHLLSILIVKEFNFISDTDFHTIRELSVWKNTRKLNTIAVRKSPNVTSTIEPEDLSFILTELKADNMFLNVTVPEGFQTDLKINCKHLSLGSASWIQDINNCFNTKIESLNLEGIEAGTINLNALLKRWVNGEYENLRRIEATFQYSKETILDGIETAPSILNSRDIENYRFLIWHEDSNILDVPGNKYGNRASLVFLENKFFMITHTCASHYFCLRPESRSAAMQLYPKLFKEWTKKNVHKIRIAST